MRERNNAMAIYESSKGFFTALEAQRKIGKTVQTKVAFRGLPLATRGRVSDASQSLAGSFVIVSWDVGEIMGNHRWHEQDSFSKEHYGFYLAEVE